MDKNDPHYQQFLEDIKDAQKAESLALTELAEAAQWYADRKMARMRLQVALEEYKKANK